MAGQDANFVLYNQHMEEKGETEVEVYSDYSHVRNGEANYTAQLYEIEYRGTDLFTTSMLGTLAISAIGAKSFTGS